MSKVGIIANPSAGKDIRRLVASGRVISNQEKANIITRFVKGLAYKGVRNIYFMPDKSGLFRPCIDELKNDRSKIRAFVEESLRVRAPTQGLSTRMTTQEEEFQGVKVPPGSILHLRYGAANMDEEVFKCPHQIDLDRKALTRHLTFSQGHRTCPGNGISRLEQVITWNLIFDRVKDISFTPETKFEHQPGIMLGALELILNFSKED